MELKFEFLNTIKKKEERREKKRENCSRNEFAWKLILRDLWNPLKKHEIKNLNNRKCIFLGGGGVIKCYHGDKIFFPLYIEKRTLIDNFHRIIITIKSLF